MKKGKKTKYITIEGCDGAGKTSLIEGLLKYCQENKISNQLTKEFGSPLHPLLPQMREIALSSDYELDELSGQILFGFIAREHRVKVIIPLLKKNELDLIIGDRGPESNYSYGPVHGIEDKLIKKLFDVVYSSQASEGDPDLTIYLDIDPKLARKRINEREAENFKNEAVDRVEEKGVEFQQKVRKNFLKKAKKHSKRIKVVDVKDKNKEEVVAAVVEILKKEKII